MEVPLPFGARRSLAAQNVHPETHTNAHVRYTNPASTLVAGYPRSRETQQTQLVEVSSGVEEFGARLYPSFGDGFPEVVSPSG